MKIGVVIPTLQKNEAYLRLCVDSLRASGIDWDIIVVSNGGDQYPMPDLKAQRYHTRQQGQCNAVNIGVQLLPPDIDYVMISNDDMYYPPGWDKYLRFDYPCFSPNLMEPVKPGGSAPPFIVFDGGGDLDNFDQEQVDISINNNNEGHHQLGETETTGFNFPVFIRKDLWDTIGGYDAKYDPWGSNSDTDLQTLIELSGVQPMRLRDVLVYHFSNKSGTFDGTHQDAWQKNWDYYTEKWGFNRDDEPKPDTWMALDMVNKEKNKFHPEWENKYGN